MRDFINIADDFKKKAEKQLGEAVSAAHGDIIKYSPVLTGRFRKSWLHSNEDTNAVAPVGNYPEPTPVPVENIKIEAEHRLINNLDYATQLCLEGKSKKAAYDWFTSIGQKWQAGGYMKQSEQNDA